MESMPNEYRAGGIVFRCVDKVVEYLLVTSNSNQNRWIIPAGHIEAGESAPTAALREVEEEAGVQAKIVKDLGRFHYIWNRGQQRILIDTHLYLMEYTRTIADMPEGRKVQFFSVNQIKLLNIWDESRAFLGKAHQETLSLGKTETGT